MKVSVITPIYNVAQYLPQCLGSLAAQTLDDIEFICVNDGSTDNSLEILQGFAKKDSRFKVINKPNGGYGQAMNCGLDAATGEYIGILESDDFISADAFASLYALAQNAGFPDVVKANYYNYTQEGGERFRENYAPEFCGRILHPGELGFSKLICGVASIWSAVYRRQFLLDNGIRFRETPGAAYQDTGFLLQALCLADGAWLTHDAYIRYRNDRQEASVKAKGKVYNVCDELQVVEAALAAHPERRELVNEAFTAKKFATYLWNYRRISWEYKHEFLQRLCTELEQAQADGFDCASYERLTGKTDLRQIAEDPNAFFEQGAMKAARKARAAEPLVSVVVFADDDLISKQVKAMTKQKLRNYELLLPAGCEALVPQKLIQAGKARFIDEADRAAFLNAALSAARGTYITVLEDAVSPWGDTLLAMWLAAVEGSLDCVGASLRGRNGKAKHELRTARFQEGLAAKGSAALQRYELLDCTLANKLLRVGALRDTGFAFSSSVFSDVQRLQALPNRKRLFGVKLNCTLRDGDFLARVPASLAWRYRVRYHLHWGC